MRHYILLLGCCVLLGSLSCAESEGASSEELIGNSSMNASPAEVTPTTSKPAEPQEVSEEETAMQADTREWKQWVPEAIPDTALGDRPIAYAWPERESIQDANLMPDETNPACIFRNAARIAKVTVEAIVRDYGREDFCNMQRTVFRLRIDTVVQGGPLPDVVYAAVTTGYYSCRGGIVTKTRNSAALRKVGDVGYAFLEPLGYDPIRAGALPCNDCEHPEALVIPARVMAFGLFLMQNPETNRFLTRENPDLSALVGASMSEEDILSSIAAEASVTNCSLHASLCGACDTAENCYGEGSATPCGCINEWQGCLELPPENLTSSRLYQVE